MVVDDVVRPEWFGSGPVLVAVGHCQFHDSVVIDEIVIRCPRGNGYFA